MSDATTTITINGRRYSSQGTYNCNHQNTTTNQTNTSKAPNAILDRKTGKIYVAQDSIQNNGRTCPNMPMYINNAYFNNQNGQYPMTRNGCIVGNNTTGVTGWDRGWMNSNNTTGTTGWDRGWMNSTNTNWFSSLNPALQQQINSVFNTYANAQYMPIA